MNPDVLRGIFRTRSAISQTRRRQEGKNPHTHKEGPEPDIQPLKDHENMASQGRGEGSGNDKPKGRKGAARPIKEIPTEILSSLVHLRHDRRRHRGSRFEEAPQHQAPRNPSPATLDDSGSGGRGGPPGDGGRGVVCPSRSRGEMRNTPASPLSESMPALEGVSSRHAARPLSSSAARRTHFHSQRSARPFHLAWGPVCLAGYRRGRTGTETGATLSKTHDETKKAENPFVVHKIHNRMDWQLRGEVRT